MKREPKLFIEDIKLAIQRIEKYVKKLSREGFVNDEKTIDAVVRNLEIIGEVLKSGDFSYAFF